MMIERTADSEGALSGELASFLRLGVAAVVGTAGSDGRPEIARAWGLIPQPDDRTLTVFIPTAHADRTLSNLKANRRVAVTCSLPTTYEAYQLKGELLGTRDGRESDRPIVEMYREAFLSETATIGFTDELRHAHYWPVVALVVGVQQVFRQTPGAGAGELLSEGE
ncbi:MAG: pyridoxamine 5'-phosphate oxidase family protein [Dehalococcoidia bacterium]|jgi:predicted pyridoxine 5'-phosphate oxidase superfamily flavin-nucleotide-binding protein|nr:pyridoxamine 5'-phosphate oxidase family protein [Dehalococcoidia bacterium]